MNFTPVDNTGRVDGFCLVKSVEAKTSQRVIPILISLWVIKQVKSTANFGDMCLLSTANIRLTTLLKSGAP